MHRERQPWTSCTNGARGYIVALFLLLVLASPARAGSYVVTNTNDSGAGSLRQAILDLNAAGDASNTITFETSGTITLSSNLADINEDVTLVNGSSVKLVLDAAGVNLNGLYMDGGGGITYEGTIPDADITGTGGGAVGAGGDAVEFNSDISGTIKVSDLNEAYGLGADLLRVSDISGTISARTTTTGATGLYGNTMLHIKGDISGTVSASSGTSDAYGLSAPVILMEKGLSGTITSTSATGDAFGIYALDMDVTDGISGTITASAGADGAFGVYALDLDMGGDLSGTITASADGNIAVSVYSTNDMLLRGGVSGTVQAYAGGHTAIGICSDAGIKGGNGSTYLDISGSVSAEARGLAVALAAWDELLLEISGLLSGVDTSGAGNGYAIRSGRDDSAGGWAGDNNVNDGVVLKDGAAIIGHIDLGGGTNDLSMQGAGTMTGDLRNITTLDKSGVGTWTVNGHTGVTDLNVNGGSLRLSSSAAGLPTNQVSGDLTVAQGATLEVDIYQTAASSLDVTGQSQVQGTVAFIPRTLLASGSTFTAMNAGALGTTTGYTAALFDVDTSSGTNVVLTKKGYDSVQGLSGNAQILADLLSPHSSTATGDLATLLLAVEDAATVSDFEANLMELVPVAQVNLTGQSFGLGDLFAGAVATHLAEARTTLLAAGMDPDDPESWPLLADAGDLSTLGGLALGEDRQTMVYLRVLGQDGGAAAQEGSAGYSYRTTGLSGGMDWLLRDDLVGGVNLAFAETETDYNDGGTTSEVESWSLAGYATLFGRDWFLESSLSLGRNAYEAKRDVGVLARTAESDFTGYLASASVGGGIRYDAGGLELTPLASLELARLDQEAYSETGAGAANLTISSQARHSLVSSAGLGAAMVFHTDSATIRPHLSAQWLHEFLTRDRGTETEMQGVPGETYTMFSAEEDRDGARIGAGLTLGAENGSSLSLEYRGEFREHSWTNGGVLEYRLSF